MSEGEYALFRGADGVQFVKAEFSGVNESGFVPIGAEIIVLLDKAAERTAGNVLTPESYRERMNVGSESGVVVALGSAAFANYPESERPKVGDRVVVEKFAGREFVGRDGKPYRIMTYSCVGAIEEGTRS